jgi:hypothetical protein
MNTNSYLLLREGGGVYKGEGERQERGWEHHLAPGLEQNKISDNNLAGFRTLWPGKTYGKFLSRHINYCALPLYRYNQNITNLCLGLNRISAMNDFPSSKYYNQADLA